MALSEYEETVLQPQRNAEREHVIEERARIGEEADKQWRENLIRDF